MVRKHCCAAVIAVTLVFSAGPVRAQDAHGSIAVGQQVARDLHLNYVDRMVFAEAARIIGSPVSILMAKEQRVERFGDRVTALLGRVLERAAVSGDYDLGVGIETLPETYYELAGESSSRVQRVNDQLFIDTTREVVRNLAQAGHVVIIGRGANVILGDTPGVLHVGMLAPMSRRVETIMEREKGWKRQGSSSSRSSSRCHRKTRRSIT